MTTDIPIETHIYEENDNIESKFDSLAVQLKQISNESSLALSKISTNSLTPTSIHDISNRVNTLLSMLHTVKREMLHQNITIPYHRSYLNTLSESQLIHIIISHNHTHKSDINTTKQTRFRSQSAPRHPHQVTIKRIKATERNPTNYQLIERQRAAIKALKQQRKRSKSNHKSNDKSDKNHNLFMDPHEKTVKGMKARERMATNYDLIERRRERIKALKKERKLQRSQPGPRNSILRRRVKAQQQMLGLFNHAHETKYNLNCFNKTNKLRRITLLRRVSMKKDYKPSKGKVRILRDDEVLRFSEEIPIENFLKALNCGFIKIMNEEEQNEEYLEAIECAKNLVSSDVCNYEYVLSATDEWISNDDGSDSGSDWEEHELDEHELLEKELMLLNLKTLKKRCKERKLSVQGGKLELIQKIFNMRQQNELVVELDEDTPDTHM